MGRLHLNAFQLLLIAFIVIPLGEIYVLIQVGSEIGALPTIVLVVLTAVIGATLMRSQGLATVTRLQAEVQRGEAPAQTIIEGALILFAGALLLMPGFITDVVGFACLTPLVRAAFARRMVAGAVVNMVDGMSRGAPSGPGRRPGGGPRGSGIIDGEFTRDDSQGPGNGPRIGR